MLNKVIRSGTFLKWEPVDGKPLQLVALIGGEEVRIRLGKGAHKPGLRKGAAIECRVESRDGEDVVLDIGRPVTR